MSGYRRLGENSWEITEGVWLIRLSLPFPPSFVNVYLLRKQMGYVLVDCGLSTPTSLSQLENALQDVGLAIGEIAQILITHIHPDHYGQASEIKRRSGADLLLHRMEARHVHSRYVKSDGLLEQIRSWLAKNGVPEEVVESLNKASLGLLGFVGQVELDRLLDDGDKVQVRDGELETLWTPGHAPGHLCFYFAKRRLLLSGDHVLENITPHIGLHPQSSDNPLADYLASLSRLVNLEIDLVLPGHGVPFGGFRARIERIQQHHRDRCENVHKALRGGSKTAYEIIRHLWDMDLDDVNRRAALAEVLAHLEFIHRSGRVRREERHGLIYWCAQ